MGLWKRGDPTDVPLNHFRDCENIQFQAGQGFNSRDGLGIYQDVEIPLSNIIRMYNYPTQDANTLLVLTSDGDIYHIIDATTTFLVLSIPEMTDFGFVQFAGRAYITPFFTDSDGFEKGLDGEFLYVYSGDGATPARPAGVPPLADGIPPFAVSNGTGQTDAGFHLFGVVAETDTGAFSSISPIDQFTTSASNGVTFSNVPISPETYVIARHIVATKVITDFNGDEEGYQYFFIPGATIPNNVGTTLSNITFFDSQLLQDASYLFDIFSQIPAGVNLSIYHNRLVLNTTFTDISVAYVSAVGEPESINQVDGLLVAPLDGSPLTITQEMRDVLYGFKRNRTISWVDNGDIPSTWPMSVIDYAMGCPVHGIATVLNSGASSIDYLLVAAYQGIQIFNGSYLTPELSWKVRDLWYELDRELFRRIQMLNDPITKRLYIVLPDRRLLVGDYNLDIDPQKMRWAPWRFDADIYTIALYNIDQLFLGASQV